MAVFTAGSDGVKLAHKAHFIALEGTATVSVLIRDAFVPDADVLSDDAGHFTCSVSAKALFSCRRAWRSALRAAPRN